MGNTALYSDNISSIRRSLDRPIALVGMMGSGKSRLGRALSDALGISFVDTDDEIERAAGMSISDIFERFGEPYFRDGERRVIKRLLGDGVQVVATGGGAVINPDTLSDLQSKAVMIWVKADMDVMLERTSKSDRRPLLKKGDPEKILRDLAEVRYPLYEKAHITVESRRGPIDETLAEALAALSDYLFEVRQA